MGSSKELYQGIKKGVEIVDELCLLQYKMGCLESDHDTVCQRVSALLKKKAPIATEPVMWWLCGEPKGEMLNVATYHDAERYTFYFLLGREAEPVTGEEWVAYRYKLATEWIPLLYGNKERIGQAPPKERAKWLDEFLGDKLWFWLWLLMTATYCLQYIKVLIN